MKKTILFILLVLAFGFSSGVSAQDSYDAYVEFVKNRRKELNDSLRRENKKFVDLLRQGWKPYKRQKPVPSPLGPKPERPIIYDLVPAPDVKPAPHVKPEPKPQPEVKPDPKPEPKPVRKRKTNPNPDKSANRTSQPVMGSTASPSTNCAGFVTSDAPADEKVTYPSLKIDFYGREVSVPDILPNRFFLDGTTGDDVANAWDELTESDYPVLVNACLDLRRRLNLCDWGYLQLIDLVAKKYCVENAQSDIALFKAFLLRQSGYKARFGLMGGHIVLLINTDSRIYDKGYFNFDEDVYYPLDDSSESQLMSYPLDPAGSLKSFSLRVKSVPYVGDEPYYRTLKEEKFNFEVHSKVNKKLIDFYKTYPHSELSVYASAAVSGEIRHSVLPSLMIAVSGKSETEGAGILLDFVQNSFEYKNDEQQFGYEKPFFVEELFYYPYADCEDRSVLYSFLVRELLGLDVVLLKYPGHIATAVKFSTDVPGSNVIIKGEKYVICDPTYINARIGMVMPQFSKEVPVLMYMK